MRWENERRSQNVEDRRGQKGRARNGLGKSAGFPIPLKGKSGLAILVIVILCWLFWLRFNTHFKWGVTAWKPAEPTRADTICRNARRERDGRVHFGCVSENRRSMDRTFS